VKRFATMFAPFLILVLLACHDSVCGICRMPFEACCPGVKFPGDDCPPVFGQCGHALHMQCVMKWLESQQNARQEVRRFTLHGMCALVPLTHTHARTLVCFLVSNVPATVAVSGRVDSIAFTWFCLCSYTF
jgi:hypothetical protein